MDVSDKAEEIGESFSEQLSLWKELTRVDDDIDEWMTSSVNEMNASLSTLDDVIKLQSKLAEIKEELAE